jgi:hypothetical protein
VFITIVHPWAGLDVSQTDIYVVDAAALLYAWLDWKNTRPLFVSWNGYLNKWLETNAQRRCAIIESKNHCVFCLESAEDCACSHTFPVPL